MGTMNPLLSLTAEAWSALSVEALRAVAAATTAAVNGFHSTAAKNLRTAGFKLAFAITNVVVLVALFWAAHLSLVSSKRKMQLETNEKQLQAKSAFVRFISHGACIFTLLHSLSFHYPRSEAWLPMPFKTTRVLPLFPTLAECRNPANTALLAVELLQDELKSDLDNAAAMAEAGGGDASPYPVDAAASHALALSGLSHKSSTTAVAAAAASARRLALEGQLEYTATIRDAITQQIHVFNDGASCVVVILMLTCVKSSRAFSQSS